DVGNAETAEARAVTRLGERLRDGAPEPADDRVVLDGDDRTRVARRRDHRLRVERLHRVTIEDAGADAVVGETTRGAIRVADLRAARDDRRVAAFVRDRGAAERE